ncbi:MAG TPA: hypothetical protein VNH11_08880 [Pirellulales bacterium]|nr:hypothetical protein [Pirellulales bacterium]
MPSRPQFSLRVLLFVTLMVCLAAATLSEPPAERTLANHVQGSLRIALCVALPAMLVAGAAQRGGYARSFCIGGLFPALAGLALVCTGSNAYLANVDEYLEHLGNRGWPVILGGLWKSLPGMRHVIALTWILIPCSGCATVFLHRLFRLNEQENQLDSEATGPRSLVRMALVAAISVGLVVLASGRPPAPAFAASAQALLRVALSMASPGMLTLGAVHSRGCFRTFCVGAALQSFAGSVLMCETLFQDTEHNSSDASWLLREHYAFAVVWASAPLFGLACVFVHLLLQLVKRSAAKE